MDQLLAKLNDNGLIDENGYIVLERISKTVDGKDQMFTQAVDVDTFKSFFDSTDYSHTQLTAADQGKGYTRFFDSWKTAGIL